jgi:hypothetical protein
MHPQDKRDAVNEPDMTEWFSVAQAAVALGVSERAVQKRCHNGKLTARRITTPQGTRWEVLAEELTRTNTRTPEPNQDANEPSKDANQRPNANIRTEPTNSSLTGHEESQTIEDANQRTDPNELANEPGRELVEQLRSEISFLRGQIEFANRQASESTAALREHLKLSAKALPSGTTEEVEHRERKGGDQAPSALRQDGQEGPKGPKTTEDTKEGEISSRNEPQRPKRKRSFLERIGWN